MRRPGRPTRLSVIDGIRRRSIKFQRVLGVGVKRGPAYGGVGVRHSGSSSPVGATAAARSRFSRRRHIDLQRVSSCLCHG
ncbi:putative leader peptide [Streptomyces sp. NPDC047042]|uniref:putative leader peptide n=1 Tax=Streptomyces sp. NPDC047042 TaxID=3154807 RepID=UPI0033D5CDF6